MQDFIPSYIVQASLGMKEGGDQLLSKRMRLDSADKNAVMEGERREVEMEVLDDQAEPPSCCSGRLNPDTLFPPPEKNLLRGHFTCCI